ncbi:MAG TPA: PEP-CTERM sorting domain-containing protein [Verrucomicrobiae bacterium]|nr:PEP-CTERM sorting domain-containing protein [Verrucomicrobiae bacterium]
MMTTNRLLSWAICLSTALFITHAPVSDAQIVDGPPVSMANLTNGQTIVVGDKAFTDFTISGDYQANQVNVTPITENGDFGIRFSGPFVSSGTPMAMTLGYQVSVTNSLNLISAANLLFNGVVVGGAGTAQVTEQVFTNNTFYGQMSVFATQTSTVSSASLAIVPPQPLLTINKNVSLTATVPAFSSISTIDQTFTQVPEPSAMVLVAAGFSGLALLRRRRS